MLTCDDLKLSGITHGFFTRQGGVSGGILASLNCGYGSGDETSAVDENRSRVLSALGGKTLCTAYQIHSPVCVVVDQPWALKDAPQADAMVTKSPGVALGILTADCLPVLFADAEARVVGAAHAGWKGAIGGVREATLDTMQAQGARLVDIHACIGPAIGAASYEVGPEFRDNFLKESRDNECYFRARANGRFLFDLPAYGASRLKAAGLIHINLLAHDTCLEENAFFSYRRSCLRGEPSYGRQISAIVLHK